MGVAMLHTALLSLCLALAAPNLGCVGSATVSADVVTPRLVWIAPGVWVVEDYQAVYFYDDFYWRYSAGVWYRSTVFDGGFVRIGVAPPIVVRAYRPRRFIRYRAPRRVRAISKRLAAEKAAHRVKGVLDVANDIEVKVSILGTNSPTATAQEVSPEPAIKLLERANWRVRQANEALESALEKADEIYARVVPPRREQ